MVVEEEVVLLELLMLILPKFTRPQVNIQIVLAREEVLKHPLDAERGWSTRLLPLAEELVSKYRSFLPNLAYPVRAGTHTNTAFGLVFPVEYDQHGG